MAGTKRGGQVAAMQNKRKYGEDYYKRIGAMGGKASGKPKGFAYAAANGLEWHKTAGAKGGSISRRNRPDHEGTRDHLDVTDRRS